MKCKNCHYYKGCDYISLIHEDMEERCKDYLDADRVLIKPESGIGDLSDGYHTFNELYHHRAILFSVICNLFPEKAWKSKKHYEGDMFKDMFIVGIETPEGQATYHYNIDPYWDMFKVQELENAPKWDGHTPAEAIDRISKLCTKLGKWRLETDEEEPNPMFKLVVCSACGQTANHTYSFCPNCGASMTRLGAEPGIRDEIIRELERKSWTSYSDVARRNLIWLDDAIKIVRSSLTR